jgi:dihydroflavonol-4-reductase
MKIAITGASGHIGANLTRALIDRGDQVKALVHSGGTALHGLPYEQVPGHLLDPAAIDSLIQGAEVVFHLAAKISLKDVDPEVMVTNVEGVRRVTEACLRHGVRRLVHFSSIHAFTPEPAGQVLDERRPLIDDPRQPPYDQSKAAGQRVVQEAVARGLDAVIVHPAGVIGPHDHGPSRMGRVLLAVARGRMPAVVEGGFSWVDVRDVVAAALAAEKVGQRGENYLLSGHWHEVKALTTMIAAAAGVRPPLLTTPFRLAWAVAPAAVAVARALRTEPLFNHVSLQTLQNHRHTSHQKAHDALGFTPRPTRETIDDTVAWFRQAGHLGR